MTLGNIRDLLILNNREILNRIDNIKFTLATTVGIETALLRDSIAAINDLLEQARKDIENVNTHTLTGIMKKLDDIDKVIAHIQENSIQGLRKQDEELARAIALNVEAIKSTNEAALALTQTVQSHLEDATIHVTQDDKDLWDAMLAHAKQYAKELFQGVTSFRAEVVSELPKENIESMCIYLLAVNPAEKDCYEEYMYINGKWETIGSTRIDLTPYILKEEVYDLLKDYMLKKDSHAHGNSDVRDGISEEDGLLSYKG
jgi:gas vesicle protein